MLEEWLQIEDHKATSGSHLVHSLILKLFPLPPFGSISH